MLLYAHGAQLLVQRLVLLMLKIVSLLKLVARFLILLLQREFQHLNNCPQVKKVIFFPLTLFKVSVILLHTRTLILMFVLTLLSCLLSSIRNTYQQQSELC